MRKIIRTDGSEEQIDSKKSMAALKDIIGADSIDTVLLRGRVHVMLVDDLGHSKNLPVNEAATALYLQKCRPGTTHQIRGDVVIVPDEDFA